MGLDWQRIGSVATDRPWSSLALCILVVELAEASGSVFTASGLDGWYATLQRPAIAPPDWVFGPVWVVLFALLGVAVWRVWRRAGDRPRESGRALAVFIGHFAITIAWSAAFFGLRNIALGFGVIVALWLAIVVTMWTVDRVDRRSALLLVPYLLWVTFAAVLNYRYLVLN